MSTQPTLAEQLRARIREHGLLSTTKLVAGVVREVVSEGLFGNGESREQYEKRIMETPEAWKGVSFGDSSNGSILPR